MKRQRRRLKCRATGLLFVLLLLKSITSLWLLNHSGQEHTDPKLSDYCCLCKPHHKNGFYYLTVFVDFIHHGGWEMYSMIQPFLATNFEYEEKYHIKQK